MNRFLRTAAVALVAIVFVMVFSATATAHAANVIRWVDDTAANNGNIKCPTTGTFPTIQAAVAASGPSDTIRVCPGTYVGPVELTDKVNFKLLGLGLPTIQAPASFDGAILEVSDSTNVTFQGFVIDGAENFESGSSSMFGIHFHNTSGTIQKNFVTRIRHSPLDGIQQGVAILLTDDDMSSMSKVKVYNNTVSDYQKGGIVAGRSLANGGANVFADIKNNRVVGVGATPSIAQNGIQISYGATGQVVHNSVNGNTYSGASWTSSGILIFESANVKVGNNTTLANQSGLVAETWCWVNTAPMTGIQFTGNKVFESDYGITIDSIDFSGYTQVGCNPHADSNRASGNKVWTSTIGSGDTGIFVGTTQDYGGSTPEVATANLNAITGNSVFGYPTGQAIDTSTATNTLVKGNKIGPLPPGKTMGAVPAPAPRPSPSPF